MKKLLTLILPALVLTTGAPLAQECEYGYSSIAYAKGYDHNEAGTYFLGHGLDAKEAESAALAACKKSPQVGAFPCQIPLEGLATRGAPGYRCAAAIRGRDKFKGRVSDSGTLVRWGANEADAKKSAIEDCPKYGGTTCGTPEVVCTECLADKGYRYGAFARDQASDSGKYGWATNFQSGAAAVEGALSECAQIGGQACEIVLTFSTEPFAAGGGYAYEFSERDEDDPNGNRCFAYVDDGDGQPAYPELKVGSSRQEAIDKSMRYCNEGPGPCAVQLALCADADEVLAAD